MICMSLAKGAVRHYLETIRESAAKGAKPHLAARLASCAVVIVAAALAFAPSISQAQFLGQDFVTGTADGATATGSASTAVGTASTASGTQSSAFGQGASAGGVNSTAVGTTAAASGVNSSAFGQGATASGTNSTASGTSSTASSDQSAVFGAGATASGSASTASGYSSTASGANSAAFGSGAAATKANQQMFGTSSNTYTTPGITSAASKAVQTGPVQLVTSDAGGDLATGSLSGLGIASSAELNNVANRAYSGVAMAFAMAGVPTVLPGERFVTTMNYGTFEGANALSFNGAMHVTDHIQFDAGIGYAPDQGIVGGRAGVRIGW